MVLIFSSRFFVPKGQNRQGNHSKEDGESDTRMNVSTCKTQRFRPIMPWVMPRLRFLCANASLPCLQADLLLQRLSTAPSFFEHVIKARKRLRDVLRSEGIL